jgi:hypothetical protein
MDKLLLSYLMETKTIFISIQMTEINELKNLKDILEGLMDNVLQV